MDPPNQAHSLINIESQNKLSYISIINSEPVAIETSQQPLKNVEINAVPENPCLYNDAYDDEEPKPKLRKRNPDNWKQNVRKRNKNKGLEYVKANGEVCERKKLGPPCTCKEKCYLKIGMDACEKIFQNFWKLGDHTLQNAYIEMTTAKATTMREQSELWQFDLGMTFHIVSLLQNFKSVDAGCVRIFLPKHCYKKDGIPSRRFFSRNFHVTVNGVDTEVCKQAFLNMHAISNGRLDRLLKKKQEIGNTGFDERGRHSNKVNKIPVEKIQSVRKHIDSVRERAGYTGKRKPKKVEILPGSLNIRTMYRFYREEMQMKGLEPVCEYRYRKIFHSDFHLDFGKTVAPSPSASEAAQAPPQTQELPQLTSQPVAQSAVAQDKDLSKMCQRNNGVKKMDAFSNLTLQDMNINVQVNSSSKGSKQQVPVYSQLAGQGPKDYQIRAQEATSYVLSQEVFRLDYSSSYTSPQQNWIFPNQN